MKALKWLAALIVVLALGLWALGSMMVKNSQTAINTMLSERTGLQTQINGALGWRMLWPTAVTIEDISARDEAGTESWHLEQLRLELSPLHILQHPTAPERWRYQAVALQGLSGARGSAAAADAATSYQVDSFRLRGLEDGQAAPFEARLAYRDGAAAPVALQLSGQLRLSAENRQLKFEPALLAGDIADGKCNAEISLRPILPDSPEAPAAATDVLNLDRWRRTDWNLECALDRLRWAGAEFADVTLQSNNLAGISQSEVELPVFFSGSANLKMAVDTSPIDDRAGPRWVLTPVVDNVAAAQLDDWLAAALPQDPADAGATAPARRWEGPVSVTGRIETWGNARSAMLHNARGEMSLVSNNGTIDLTEIKQRTGAAVKDLQGLLGDTDPAAQWPDQLEYLTLTGRWVPTGERQQLNARLDNVLFEMVADIAVDDRNAAADAVSARGTLTFSTTQPPNTLLVPPLLQDLPLPLRCDGTPLAPECQLDGQAARRLIANAMKGGDGSLGNKIDELIEANVPEEYRAAARGLLEIFGHSVSDDETLDDFLGDDLDDELEERADETGSAFE